MLRTELRGSNDHTGHKGRPHLSTRASSQLFHTASLLTLQGMQRLLNTTCPFPQMGPPSPKYQRQSLFILNEAAANPRILPEGLLPPDAWARSLGTRVGFVLEISNATRRCEHALRLFLSLIFTSKPQTKGQVAKNSHWTI